jgi:hypothetical protein
MRRKNAQAYQVRLVKKIDRQTATTKPRGDNNVSPSPPAADPWLKVKRITTEKTGAIGDTPYVSVVLYPCTGQ